MDKIKLLKLKTIIPVMLILFATFACRIGAVPATPTSPPTPIPLPVQPTEIVLPTISLDTEVIIPELQFTEISPTATEDESIWIQSPMSGEQVNGEWLVQGISDPTFEQNLVIRLVDENGSELIRTNTIIQSEAGTRGKFSTTIKISDNLTQLVIIQVFSSSPKDGSLVHLSSIVVFLNSGNRSGTDSNSAMERILISNVTSSGTSPDTTVIITGSAWGSFENILNYAVCGENSGNTPDLVCGSLENRLVEGVITTTAADMGLTGEFTITIPTADSLPPSATIVVYSISPMNGAIDHAASHNLIPDK